MSEMADTESEGDVENGVRYYDPYRFDCEETRILRILCREFEDVRKLYVSSQQRESWLAAKKIDPDSGKEKAGPLEELVEEARRRVEKALKQHPTWDFLETCPGTRGALMGIVISAISNPHRFPGQCCSEGHYLPGRIGDVGDSCHLEKLVKKTENKKETWVPSGEFCPGVLLETRPGTGTRSLWHYLGLHVDEDGKSPRKRKGHQATWHMEGRAALLEPETGIAAQIVRNRANPYRPLYDEVKERMLVREELRPIQRERIARKVAAKALVGDLLAFWKEA